MGQELVVVESSVDYLKEWCVRFSNLIGACIICMKNNNEIIRNKFLFTLSKIAFHMTAKKDLEVNNDVLKCITLTFNDQSIKIVGRW